jgi:hypothetical protein
VALATESERASPAHVELSLYEVNSELVVANERQEGVRKAVWCLPLSLVGYRQAGPPRSGLVARCAKGKKAPLFRSTLTWPISDLAVPIEMYRGVMIFEEPSHSLTNRFRSVRPLRIDARLVTGVGKTGVNAVDDLFH